LSTTQTGVLGEALLRNPVKRERSDGCLETGRDQAPQAMRATPAGKVLVFRPNHMSIYSWFVRFGFLHHDRFPLEGTILLTGIECGSWLVSRLRKMSHGNSTKAT